MKKKGVSPVIATVLLVAIVVVLAAIIFLWFRSLQKETILKFGENVELTCDKVSLEAEFVGENLLISNRGNIPISGIKVKITEEGGYRTEDLLEFNGLDSGDSGEYSFSGSGTLELIPVLTGLNEDGNLVDYVCDDKYAQEVF